MLAYVYWHRSSTNVNVYESALINFHRNFDSQSIPGYLGSIVAKVEGAGWLSEGDCYEDWYLLENSGVLDLINEAAVSDRMREIHDSVASISVDGKGGLYGLLRGNHGLLSAHCYWFFKPRGMKYSHFYSKLTVTQLWRRMLAMGPTPEFCAMGEEVEGASKVKRNVIYNGAKV
jgi:hypothetical protein